MYILYIMYLIDIMHIMCYHYRILQRKAVELMIVTGATEARKNWSNVCDSVARIRPSMIKRTHDYIFISSLGDMIALLSGVKYDVSIYEEADGSYTAASNDVDLAENAGSKEDALNALAGAVIEYANEYYEEFQLYSKAPNRKEHLTYIMKALLLNDIEKIRGEMICQAGEN